MTFAMSPFNFCLFCFNNYVAIDVKAFIFWWPEYEENGTITSEKAGGQVEPLISEHRLIVGSVLLSTVHITRRKCIIYLQYKTIMEHSIFIRPYMISAMTVLHKNATWCMIHSSWHLSFIV